MQLIQLEVMFFTCARYCNYHFVYFIYTIITMACTQVQEVVVRITKTWLNAGSFVRCSCEERYAYEGEFVWLMIDAFMLERCIISLGHGYLSSHCNHPLRSKGGS